MEERPELWGRGRRGVKTAHLNILENNKKRI